MLALLSIALGTLVSEDLTCIATGVLIQRGDVGAAEGVLACAAGIFVGDLGLWAAGRVCGLAVFDWPRVAHLIERRHWNDMRTWLERHAGSALVSSRFLPGARLPLYVCAGALNVRLSTFATWTLLACLLWTPTIVLGTAAFGDAVIVNASTALWPAALAGGAVWLLLRAARAAFSRQRIERVTSRLARWCRWEFWPMPIFYAPVAVYVVFLALRHRGLSTITAANPGIADGGTVGESKFDILQQLPSDCVIPSMVVEPGPVSDRLEHVRAHLSACEWRFPLVLKPDVGQRGAGVKVAQHLDDVAAYLTRSKNRVLVQPYHDGPFEAGVFYVRFPGDARGRIISVTDKQFPFVMGDGVSTIETLIRAHPRYRMQAHTFLRRHHEVRWRIVKSGERFQLAIAGNHAQGTVFRDGRHLLTAALERRIDDIAQSFDGFYVGRFDVRYREVEAFKAGKDLSIVELNGATAESTNIYDPDASLWAAYRQLFRQWSMVFAIGTANRAGGTPVTSHRRLWRLIRAHLSTDVPFAVSD